MNRLVTKELFRKKIEKSRTIPAVMIKYVIEDTMLISNQNDWSMIELCRGIKVNIDIANPQQHNTVNT